LTEVDRWKASEFRQFILYAGVLVLKPVIEKELYKHYLYLFVAVYTLLSPRLCWHYADYAKELLELFVTDCFKLYGSQFFVYNVHNLVHIADDVKKFGHLNSILWVSISEFFRAAEKKCP
jgi:hypothetical protein